MSPAVFLLFRYLFLLKIFIETQINFSLTIFLNKVKLSFFYHNKIC